MAEYKGADKMLSDGAPDGVMEQLVYYYYAYVVPGFVPYMLGVVTCAILFGTYDIWVRRQRGGTLHNDTPAKASASSNRLATERERLIASWQTMAHELSRRHNEEGRLAIDRAIRESPHYYSLQPYLRHATRKALRATAAGIRIEPILTIGGEETLEERAMRMLRSDIARLEHDWDGALSDLREERQDMELSLDDFHNMLDEMMVSKEEEDIASVIRSRREYVRLEPELDLSAVVLVESVARGGRQKGGAISNRELIQRLRRAAADLEASLKVS